MAEYSSEEAGRLLMLMAKVLVMDQEPQDVAANVKKEETTFAVAGTGALISWLGEFITHLVLEDLPEEEDEDAPS